MKEIPINEHFIMNAVGVSKSLTGEELAVHIVAIYPNGSNVTTTLQSTLGEKVDLNLTLTGFHTTHPLDVLICGHILPGFPWWFDVSIPVDFMEILYLVDFVLSTIIANDNARKKVIEAKNIIRKGMVSILLVVPCEINIILAKRDKSEIKKSSTDMYITTIYLSIYSKSAPLKKLKITIQNKTAPGTIM
nr:11139_t:CDS:2 [Entrophospora candida]